MQLPLVFLSNGQRSLNHLIYSHQVGTLHQRVHSRCIISQILFQILFPRHSPQWSVRHPVVVLREGEGPQEVVVAVVVAEAGNGFKKIKTTWNLWVKTYLLRLLCFLYCNMFIIQIFFLFLELNSV